MYQNKYMSSYINQPKLSTVTSALPNIESLKGELVRKFLHISIAFTPLLAELSFTFTVILLSTGVLVYSVFEYLRCIGIKIFLISDITEVASRSRDAGKFVLGPVTLGTGTLLALLLYPSPASYLAIYALAFGDGLASLAGKAFGRTKIPHFHNKTYAGTIACFVAVFVSCFTFSNHVGFNLIIALTATILEILPVRDIDNIVIPIGTGLVATVLYSFL